MTTEHVQQGRPGFAAATSARNASARRDKFDKAHGVAVAVARKCRLAMKIEFLANFTYMWNACKFAIFENVNRLVFECFTDVS